ncbi:pyridoxamine 5'-phosphate oxidase family protein [Campylobacter hyointestinalis]|uniref:Pyridoxamine 5'-phosphate oxidase family protein n=1 Tax=Campylobacter hyointestinalis subsp. lawsonii TaxID=91353 RepID=A0AAV6EIH0_CAMHY|nr:pyridoxamine 5'-phosphate oxidase family protein [Campylobacter hyointestinalis]KAB0613724.1 pyridoxamine 5'-phosphate oxidase family protein [Campylobacter hyointestinalis subsp. lawsonii]QKF70320.1 pyridoxamine 5'-phosphate oxidase-related, FMN-binding protein [Campylobacter hyointestinalis subsp. lawsonii]RAZ29250.1 pyridoxamine 5'-phosphate oxidase family protein [Campylobacter hyointestinalis subsp. lawsonii]
MRRSDRELDQEIALKIIDECQYATLSCIDENNEIFSIPISIARDGMSIYIHGAKTGSKARLYKDGKNVELVAVSQNRVPTPSYEFCESIKDSASKLGSNIFTTEYLSAIAKTKAYEVTNESQKIKALELLCRKYTPDYMDYFKTAAYGLLDITSIYELKIKCLSAKAKIIK